MNRVPRRAGCFNQIGPRCALSHTHTTWQCRGHKVFLPKGRVSCHKKRKRSERSKLIAVRKALAEGITRPFGVEFRVIIYT